MAIGFKKFIVGGAENTESVIDYLADPQARGDYYSEGGQAVLRWLATPRLQRLFGLGGPLVLGRTRMRMLLEGRHPVSGEPIRRWGPNGTVVGAIDVTLSPAPKSVSVLWALADREMRHEIERMVWLSADFAIAALMRKPLVRQRFGRGKNDVRHEAMADIVGVQTLHTTARLSERGDGVPDPQLHVHSLLMGAVDATGRLRALDSRQMMIHQREIDARASATLAEMFRMRGFPIARVVDDRGRVSWELAGIPAAVLLLASSRRSEITAEGPGSLREQFRAWSRERFGAEQEPLGQAWEDFVAAHRGPKAALQGLALRQAWADQYDAAGWGIQAAHDYIVRAGLLAQAGIIASDDNADAIEQFRQEFLADVCREHALVPEAHVAAVAFEKAMGLIDVTTAMVVVGAMYSDGDLLVAPDGRVTTLGVVAYEQRARQAAQQLIDATPGEAPSLEAVQRAIEEAARQGLPLDEHQATAVRLATSGHRLVSITGQAGTGKGVTSGVIAPLWQTLGREVIALAVAGRTAQQAGHDARADLAKTIDGFVAAVGGGYRILAPGTVLVVDEAAMIDHARYASLMEVAAAAGATVIQVGDDKQLSPVGPGGLWTLIHASAAARGLAAELRVVRRARELAEAQAWTDVREGRVVEALQHWQARRRLRLYDARSDLQAGMVTDWWADAARGAMVVDTSNVERDVINRLAQEQRANAGELGAEVLTLDNGCQVRAGDRVLFRDITELSPAGRNRVPRIENGTEATVKSVDEAHGQVELILHEPRGERTVTVGRDVVLNLAYGRHIQLGQGMTVEGAGQVGVSARTDREHFYVMVSRAKGGAVIHAERSAVAAMAAPGLGAVTEAQEAALARLGVEEIPEDWTWADASVEIDVRRGAPIGEWAMRHLTETMQVEPLLAAHLVAQAIARRQVETGEAVQLDQVAASVRAAAAGHRPPWQPQAEPEREAAAAVAPGLGPATEAQEAALGRLGLEEIPESWTWADASVEIDVRRGLPIGEWAIQHLTETMHVEPEVAARLMAEAIGRRQAATGAAFELDLVAPSLRAAVASHRATSEAQAQREVAAPIPPGFGPTLEAQEDVPAHEPAVVEPIGIEGPSEAELTAWEAFLVELQANREALETRQGLARLLSREGGKEAVGDRPVTRDPLRDEAWRTDWAIEALARDSRPGDVDVALLRAWREQQEQLAELPLPQREPDLGALRFDDGIQVVRGEVVRFGHPDWLVGAARAEVQPGDLGVVLGCHRGGITWDYVTVELVGGRQIQVWQTAQGIVVEPDLAPAVVRDAVPRPEQRDAAALNVFELINGARLMAGDQVRFAEASTVEGAGLIAADTAAVVRDVERHRHNRAVVELDDGRLVNIYSHAELEIVRPAQEATPMPPAAPELHPETDLSRGVAGYQERWTRPLSATKPLELVARWETTDQIPRALALYDALGQLHVSDTPEQLVARLWLADPQAAIVVQTWEQAAAVRQAIAHEQAVQPPAAVAELAEPQPAPGPGLPAEQDARRQIGQEVGVGERPAPAPDVVSDPERQASVPIHEQVDQLATVVELAEPQPVPVPELAVEPTVQPHLRPEVEVGEMPAADVIGNPEPEAPAPIHEHQAEALAEPAAPAPVILIADVAYQSRLEAERTGEPALAPERAYVLSELEDHNALTRAVSVAQESHLVTTTPDQLTADMQALHAREIAESHESVEAEAEALAAANRDATAERSLQLAIEAGLQRTEAQRQAERQAGNQATPGGPGGG
jgi:conjugative relaxase-like TrwC/TraI family protein